ncbi:099811ce-411b-4082-844d-f9b42c878f83 [Thermothielavioides terrestris]|jgi:hypothetical protein|uniref:HypA-like protein n=2 Tax=Thermothielavioides terrestris TaxID=2587410 RepID=G2QYQ7_THETT|nr:uncharacterized protein THITE_37176 [Thermothielavioides terrestris NRRL 8126]AEO66249.1 hypothetical protein THITE_37176 [Thermothielavioides terrestris NRRL 8126]SPQ25358.1 099811ce-411b-4082-844d-f9b42c878f83 [Thermothielavioides terrestris]
MLPITPSPEHQGIARTAESTADAHTLETAGRLLQKNHDDFHVFWRDEAGHDHIVHSILTVLALGGDAADVQRAYDDGYAIQRARVPADPHAVARLSDPAFFLAHMGVLSHYSDFLVFFEHQIGERGYCPVVQEYCFGRTPLADTMLARLFEGLFHPIIHLGLGVEFDLPAIVAEALAMAACHNSDGIDHFFFECERISSASSAPGKPLATLLDEVRAHDKVRHAVRPEDGPACVKDGVLGRAGAEMAKLAAQYRVQPDAAGLERATAEDISCATYTAGAAQRPGKAPAIDFFYLHNVTSSLSLTVLGRETWIDVADRARLVEWKARLDLVWYAASGAVALDAGAIASYVPGPSKGMGWAELYRAVLGQHDDGHLAKFVRALKNGCDVEEALAGAGQEEEVARLMPVRGDMWLRIAQMSYDSALGKTEVLDKWIFGAGFDERWACRP